MPDRTSVFAYGAITHYGRFFQFRSTNTSFYHCPPGRQAQHTPSPQPRQRNPCRVSHANGLASSAFARHYSRNHNCFLFLWVLRCFTSPRSLQHPYTFRMRSPDTTPDIRGFPIRKSTDQSSFTSSPWLIAGYNVLHRLLMPRHPPIALSSLSPNQNNQQQKSTKMLASTIQFSNNKQTPTNTHPTQGCPSPGVISSDTHHTSGGSPRTQQRAHATPPSTLPRPFHTHHSEQY